MAMRCELESLFMWFLPIDVSVLLFREQQKFAFA